MSGGDCWGEWDDSFWAHAIDAIEKAEVSCTKAPNFSPPRELSLSQYQNPSKYREEEINKPPFKCTKTIGVQTDDDCSSSSDHNASFASIWATPTTNLFLTCAPDFYALLGVSAPSSFQSLSTPQLQSSKLAHLYYILLKLTDDITHLNLLLDALLHLATLDTLLVSGSLRILRAILQPLLASHPTRHLTIYPNTNHLHTSLQPFHVDMLFNNKDGQSTALSPIHLLSLFDKIHNISLATKQNTLHVEALSLMNLILIRTDPFLEREKFGSRMLFQTLSTLLHKDVCLQAQNQAVHLLFLLLNSPKILLFFCSGCKDESAVGPAADSTQGASALQGFTTILEGLAECVKRRGHGTQELKLRRLSIKVLSFVASSGTLGFEVFLNSKVLKGCNFLELIMQALASEMDAEAAESSVPSETCKERTSLIRESLILLNRLASGPAYSGVVLQVLTSSRDMVSLTIDVVNRMSKKGSDLWKSDSSGKRKAEDEVLDLAHALRSRVFAYLGNTPS